MGWILENEFCRGDYKAIVLGTLDQPVVEQRDGRQGQLGARLGEGLLEDLAHQLRLVVQVGKELIEFGLNALWRCH